VLSSNLAVPSADTIEGQSDQVTPSQKGLKYHRQEEHKHRQLYESEAESAYLDEDMFKKKWYVPVAMVIETDTEYHDFFRQVLLALFDMIRVPPETHVVKCNAGTCELQTDKYIESRNIAFADLVAHIAFLKTIPAPPFNSVYKIQMLPVILNN